MGITIDDLKKECRYCCREIDNSGLEGFRCINKTVNIKTSWCIPKNADEPCSICEYCSPKQDMGMTIDELIVFCEDLEKYHSTRCKRYDDASGYTRSRNEKIRTNDAKREEMDSEFYHELKEIVHKYQKIEQIIEAWKADTDIDSYDSMTDIYEVLEDGKS